MLTEKFRDSWDMEGQATGRDKAAHGVTPGIEINSSQESMVDLEGPEEPSTKGRKQACINFRDKKA